jgi:hypothetical protein
MNIENAVNHMINIQTELLNRESDLNYINRYSNRYSHRQYTNTLLNLELDNNQYARYYYDISSILESINTLSNRIETIFLTSLNNIESTTNNAITVANNTDTVANNANVVANNTAVENTFDITDDAFYNTSTYNYLFTHYYNYRTNYINRRNSMQYNTMPINNISNNTSINNQININNKLYFDKIRHLKKEKCNICYGSKKLFTKIKKCNHDFCNGCLKKWISLNTTCPICRSNIISNTIYY